jgi:multiple sugar transport system substrate-binding protein
MKLRRSRRSTTGVAALSAVVVAVALSGCGSGSSSAGGSDKVRGTTITVAMTSVPPPGLKAFEKKSGITVKWSTNDWDDLQTKITAGATAKTYFADVTDVDWSRVGQLGKLGWFHDMSTLLDTKTMAKDMPQLDEFTLGSNVVGIPNDASFLVTTVNTKLFAKAGIDTMPTSLDEYTADLKKLKSTGTVQYPLNIPFSAAEGLSTYWYEATAAQGGSVLAKDGSPLFASPSSAGYKAAEWMIDAMKSGLVSPGSINTTDSQGIQSLMAKGQVATTFSDYSGDVGSTYDVAGSSTVTGQVEYIPTPSATGTSVNLGNPDGVGVPVTAKYPKAAAAFIKWYTSSSVEAGFAGAGTKAQVYSGYALPSRLSAMKKLAAGNLVGGKTLLEMFENSVSPTFPEGAPTWYPQFSKAVYTNLHAAAAGSQTTKQAIAAIVSATTSLKAGS